jgi:hypothetical protein
MKRLSYSQWDFSPRDIILTGRATNQVLRLGIPHEIEISSIMLRVMRTGPYEGKEERQLERSSEEKIGQGARVEVVPRAIVVYQQSCLRGIQGMDFSSGDVVRLP